MNAKKILVVLGLLGMVAGQEAQAYYNFTTGRWLSRDPIEERGGANLPSGLAGVIKYKSTGLPGNRRGYWGSLEAMEATSFTAYGWHYGSSVSFNVGSWQHSCAPDSTVDDRVFSWRWKPVKSSY